eukprot:GHVQ01006795.1.p2 GENE.GHVQ01006795.1~~GHVQ01006795.1.p2  ORF type:complete len:108 (+),score=12.70 GHVQ01006795.1:391-714(+)
MEDSEKTRRALRAKIVKESIEDSGKSRHGYFGYMGPLCIGDDSSWTPPAKKTVEGYKNLVTGPSKKGQGPDTLFSCQPPLAVGDLYTDPEKRQKKNTCMYKYIHIHI